MFRRCTPLSVLLALSLVVGPAVASAGPMKFKIASIAPPSTPWAKLVKRIKKSFKKHIPKEQLKVKSYLGGALGGEKDLVNRCRSGGLGMIGVTSGALATVVPEMNVLELPYLWTSEKQVDKALAGPLGEALKKAMEKKGFVLYVWSENGFRHFATRDRFIHKPKDLRGKRMRAQPSYVHTSMYSAFGATPNPMPAPEVPGALSSGVVDGYDNSLLYAYATQWYSSIKYLTLSKHIYQPAVITFCKKVYDKLTPSMKSAMAAQANKIQKAGRSMVRKGNRAALKNHAAAKVQVAKQQNRGLFKAKAKRVWAEFAKKTPGGARLLALAKAAAK
ncbi:MAG TPA: C4-dicarboxylate ABC transporter substrate-binding protein [Myxococcales bacterium]|nr:C4-dicarboxylate ABC transporter substrate-binding protein [Myxococcales bacterium]